AALAVPATGSDSRRWAILLGAWILVVHARGGAFSRAVAAHGRWHLHLLGLPVVPADRYHLRVSRLVQTGARHVFRCFPPARRWFSSAGGHPAATDDSWGLGNDAGAFLAVGIGGGDVRAFGGARAVGGPEAVAAQHGQGGHRLLATRLRRAHAGAGDLRGDRRHRVPGDG